MTLAWKGSHRFPPAWKPSIPPALISGLVAPVASIDWTSSTAIPAWATFTATGLATQFDSTGKLTYAPNNLLTYSNTFSNAAWSKPTATVTNANAVADPFGGTAASTVTTTAGSGGIYQAFSVSAATNSVASIWVRRRTGSGNVLMYTTDGGANSVIAVDGTWRQFFRSGPTASNFGYLRIELAINGDAVDVYGGTLSFVTYETTPRSADQVITTSAAYYGPRFDYTSAAVALGLINEPIAATNIALQNRDLTNAAWTKTNITAAKTQTGIDGVANSASLITASAANGAVLQTVTLASSQRFQSAYVKRVTGSGVVNMTTDGGATWSAITVTGSYTRVSIPAQTVTNPSFGFQIVTNGDAIAVDFVQNEAGSKWSSPIAVGASAVTRAAESLVYSGYASNPFAILSAPESTGSFACNKYADQATANAAVAAANQWIKSVKIWPVGTPSGSQTC